MINPVYNKELDIAYKNVIPFNEIYANHMRLYPKIMKAANTTPQFFEYVILSLSDNRMARKNFINHKLRNQDLRQRIISKIQILTLSMESGYIINKLKRILDFIQPKPFFVLTTIKQCAVNIKENEQDDELWNLYEEYVKLVIHNLCASCYPLVTSIAKKAPKEYDFKEKVMNGRHGLVFAAYKFDFKKGVKFATYATYWVRVFIDDAGIRDKYMLTVNASHRIRATFKKVDDTLKKQLKTAIAIHLPDIGNDEDEKQEPDRSIPALQTNIDFVDILARKEWETNGQKLMIEILEDIEYYIICSRFELFGHSKLTWSKLAQSCDMSSYLVAKSYENAMKKIKNNTKLMDILQEIV